MGKYFMGKGVKLLTEETENKIRIYKLGLLQPEFGHMPCISGNAFTFLLAEEGEIQCQINQEKVDLEAGEALFINAGQSYRLVRSEKESSSFYIIEVAGEYLADFCMYDGNFLCGYVRGEAGEPEGKRYSGVLWTG